MLFILMRNSDEFQRSVSENRNTLLTETLSNQINTFDTSLPG